MKIASALSISFACLLIYACTSSNPSPQPSVLPSASTGNATAVSFKTANAIISQRCVACHSATPTQSGTSSAPAGVRFDTPAEIQAKANRILIRTVQNKNMPPRNNITQMTDSEREQLKSWIEQGAKLD